MLLDIHTHHHAPQPEGIVSLRYGEWDDMLAGQAYSAGLHPWWPEDYADGSVVEELRRAAARPEVVAIGEAGIDLPKGGLLALQMNIFAAEVGISEETSKPLIIHCVRAHDIIAGLRRDLHAAQPWIIHGFRGKPTVAKILLDAGCSLSFGEKFNADTLCSIPSDRIFAETDESELTIEEIIGRMSETYGRDLLPVVRANMKRLFPGWQCQ